MLSEYLCKYITLLSSAFSFAGRVAEGKNDWAFIERSHVPDDLLWEGSCNSCHTWDRKSPMCYMIFIYLGAFQPFLALLTSKIAQVSCASSFSMWPYILTVCKSANAPSLFCFNNLFYPIHQCLSLLIWQLSVWNMAKSMSYEKVMLAVLPMIAVGFSSRTTSSNFLICGCSWANLSFSCVRWSRPWGFGHEDTMRNYRKYNIDYIMYVCMWTCVCTCVYLWDFVGHLDNETLGIHHPDLFQALFLSESLLLHGHNNQISNPHCCLWAKQKEQIKEEERSCFMISPCSL